MSECEHANIEPIDNKWSICWDCLFVFQTEPTEQCDIINLGGLTDGIS